MKKFSSTQLINDLQAEVRQIILVATQLQKEDPALLQTAPAPGKWTVAQILEHLNSYGRFYLPAINKSLKSEHPSKESFKPGWLGDYFTKLMMPAADGTIANKMNTPKGYRPGLRTDAATAIKVFLGQQQQFLAQLENARQKDLGSIRTPISISSFIRLKLGDVFRFNIAHEQRHFVQIAHALTALRQEAASATGSNWEMRG